MIITVWKNDNTDQMIPVVKAKALFTLDGKPIVMMKISDMQEQYNSDRPVRLIELWDYPKRKRQKLLDSILFHGTLENAKVKCLKMLEKVLNLIIKKDPAAIYEKNWKFPANFCLRDPERLTFTKILNKCKEEGWVSKELTLSA